MNEGHQLYQLAHKVKYKLCSSMRYSISYHIVHTARRSSVSSYSSTSQGQLLLVSI